jgi:hypothetical protein
MLHVIVSRWLPATVLAAGLAIPTHASVTADSVVPTVSLDDVEIVEPRPVGDSKVRVTVRLSEPVPYRVTAQVVIVEGGTATPAADYFDPGTMYVSFPSGSQAETVSIQLNHDAEPEADETIQVQIRSAIGALVDDSPATITIVDNDHPARLVFGEIRVNESQGILRIWPGVERRSSVLGSVKYELVDGSATRGDDYTTKRGEIVHLPAKGIDDPIRIAVKDDNEAEGDETFFIRLFNPQNLVIPVDEIEVTVVDNDTPPVISVDDLVVTEGRQSARAVLPLQLDRPYSRDITLRVATFNGSALSGVDYSRIVKTVVIPRNTTSINLPLTILGDLNPENEEQFTIEFSTPADEVVVATPVATVTIIDDD